MLAWANNNHFTLVVNTKRVTYTPEEISLKNLKILILIETMLLPWHRYEQKKEKLQPSLFKKSTPNEVVDAVNVCINAIFKICFKKNVLISQMSGDKVNVLKERRSSLRQKIAWRQSRIVNSKAFFVFYQIEKTMSQTSMTKTLTENAN